MLSQSTIAEYRRLKRRNPEWNARAILYTIRREAAEEEAGWLEWHNTHHGEAAAYREGPFLVVLRREYDDSPDDLSDGHFTNTWTPGAVKHSDGGREYKWYVPGETAEAIAEHLNRSYGYAKGPAREKAEEYVRQEYRQAVNPEPQHILSAAVYLCDTDPDDLFRWANHVALPDAPLLGRDSLGGVYDPTDTDSREVAAEALADARAGLQAACEAARTLRA